MEPALMKVIPHHPPPRRQRSVKRVLSLFSVLAYVLSLAPLGLAIWLVMTRGYSCEKLLRITHARPGTAAALFLIFIVGNALVYSKSRFLIPGYLLYTVLLIVTMMVGIAFIGAYRMETRAFPATPLWLRNKMAEPHIWEEIKTCIYNEQFCNEFAHKTIGLNSYDFSLNQFTPIETGCCMPSESCNMQYVNATYWKVEKGSGARQDAFGDCNAWSNNERVLCYNCQSCKDGFLSKMEWRWKKYGLYLVVTTVVLMAVHLVRFFLLVVEKHTS